MMRSKKDSFLAEAGGKWFLDSKFLLLTTPLVATTSVLTTAVIPQSAVSTTSEIAFIYLELLIANIFSISVCALLVIFLGKYVFKNRTKTPVPLSLVLIVSAAIGALKGATTGFFSWLMELEPILLEAVTQRIWQTTLLGIWLVPAVALIAARLEYLQIQRDALVAQRVNAALNGQSRAFESENYKEISEFAFQAKIELSAIEDSVDSAKYYAATIRRLVTEKLRPLSHRIWEQENTKLAGFSLLETLKGAISNVGQAKTIVAAVYLVTTVPAIMRFTSLDFAILRAIAAAVVVYLGLFLAEFVKPKLVGWQIGWFALTMLAIAICVHVSGHYLIAAVPGFRPLETIFANFIWITQLSLISSFLLGVRKGREALREELSKYIGNETIEKAAQISQSRIVNREFANFLHGNVQNKLLSIALRLEQDKSSKAEAQKVLAAVDKVLESINLEFHKTTTDSLADLLDRIAAQWDGFVAVEYQNILNESLLTSRQKGLIAQIIEEGVANSVRHGLAKQIEVKVIHDADFVKIEITDDGLGPRDGKPGLGTALFKSSANENWGLKAMPSGGSKLKVTLAI